MRTKPIGKITAISVEFSMVEVGILLGDLDNITANKDTLGLSDICEDLRDQLHQQLEDIKK
jgi:hypothetical protein